MNFFLKLISLILSICFANECIQNDFALGSVVFVLFSIIMVFIILNDIITFYENVIYGENKKHYKYYDNYYDYNNITPYETKSNRKILKTIEKTTSINKNIIEIGNETEIIIDDEELLVDNTKKTKPKIHKSALESLTTINKVYNNTSQITVKNKENISNTVNESNSNSCIIISNKFDKKLSQIYRILLVIFKKQELSEEKKLALIQSIFYIDIFLDNIVIYIDDKLLKFNGLDENIIQKEKITDYIKRYLHNEKLNIMFENIGHTSLFNFYLNKTKND